MHIYKNNSKTFSNKAQFIIFIKNIRFTLSITCVEETQKLGIPY